ncbi:MAG: sulfite exporter TauE/SafE family protein [Bacteroidales bacterium]|nr:sulfite exporter TauE/SafE family protein [Bacteroidales bacterium]
MEHTAIILFLFAMLASFVQRVSGFGFGIVVMTLLPTLMPSYGEATALSGLMAIVTCVITAIKLRRFFCWEILWPLLLTFILSSFCAVHVVGMVQSAMLKKILGGVLIFLSLYFLFLDGKFHIRPTRLMGGLMGVLSGIMGGLFAMQGPPAVIYLVASTKTKESYTALTQWFFLVGNVMLTLFRWREGFVTRDVCVLWPIGCLGVLVGLLIGARVYAYISVVWLRRIVYLLLAVSGVLACCL